MKHLMALNHKFMSISPKQIVELTMKVDGYELSINYLNPIEYKYLEELAYECKINNKHFQVHADSRLDIEHQIEFMKKLENIANNLGYKINIVLHSIYDEDKEVSSRLTSDYFKSVVDSIDNNLLQITMENLNNNPMIRLDKDEIVPLICNDERIFFTYDIGHEIDSKGDVIKIPDYVIPLIKNIHLHSCNGVYDGGFDHKPIFKGDPYWDKILKSLLFLKKINYIGPIVYEYCITTCPGKNLEERIVSFIESMDFVIEHLK